MKKFSLFGIATSLCLYNSSVRADSQYLTHSVAGMIASSVDDGFVLRWRGVIICNPNIKSAENVRVDNQKVQLINVTVDLSDASKLSFVVMMENANSNSLHSLPIGKNKFSAEELTKADIASDAMFLQATKICAYMPDDIPAQASIRYNQRGNPLTSYPEIPTP